MKVQVPDGREPGAYLAFGAALASLGTADEYILDFGGVSFVSPGWMVSVGDALRKFKRDRGASRRTAANYKGRACFDYAARAGFFRSFGMRFGHEPGAVGSTESYIPITIGNVDEIRSRSFEGYAHHGDVIQADAEQMASVLTQSTDGQVHETLAYAIREIVRNVIEHSGSDQYSFAAQYWPMTGVAELVVSDEGMGVARSLKLNPRNQVADDEGALMLAVRPGVSSRDTRRRRANDVWGNSGYGLYMTKGLCEMGGSFALASGSQALLSTDDGDALVQSERDGTLVVLRLATARIGDLGDRLADLRNSASGSRVGRPSGASLSSKVRSNPGPSDEETE